jgi:hypothetical protein
MKKILLILLLGLLAGCDASTSNSKSDSIATDTSLKSDKSKIAVADTSKWLYPDEVDKMTSKTTYYAENNSTNALELKPPYDGDNDATIWLRKKVGVTNAYLVIKKGQFMVGIEGMDIRIRFDDKQPMTFSCSGSSDDDPTTIFINSPAKLIANLKKSKKMIIEATFYNDGNQLMEFDVDGLKWNH